ncbi:MAG TPA: hypothetical protein ENK67_06020 [Flavobacteriia bacterium]|jgi:hypothetical protein|nr:hypothetical protein [Flavobacteriia bacterium]
MKIDRELLHRFKLFGIGLAIGITLVIFFLNGKKSRCSWFPNERILRIIRQKHLVYSNELQSQIQNKTIDSTYISNILMEGNVDFSKSQTKNKPCRRYHIDFYDKEKASVLQVKICDSVATLSALKFK